MAKNTHLEHLEDDILNQGKQGGFNSIAFLRELGDMLTRPQSNVRVTTKWDGAPAIICGTDPVSKQFFVGTKSVFAKTAPKIIYNESDAVHYIKTIHKQGDIEKLFDIPQEIYDSEYGEVGATSIKILRCYIG